MIMDLCLAFIVIYVVARQENCCELRQFSFVVFFFFWHLVSVTTHNRGQVTRDVYVDNTCHCRRKVNKVFHARAYI